MSRWIVVQLGSREQYNVARALYAGHKLHSMVTDMWIEPYSAVKKLNARAGSRYQKDLSKAHVVSFNTRMMIANGFDRFTSTGFRKKFGMIADRMFSRLALGYLKRNDKQLKRDGVTHIFSYNYYCADIFQWASANGYTCVLGQIDAGPAAGKLVKKLAVRYNVDPSLFHDHYEDYLPQWRTETRCASVIAVNSGWSKQLITEEGVSSEKVKVIPLAFDNPGKSIEPKTVAVFTTANPLKVLFLGSMQIQKGIIEIFEAAAQLISLPVRFTFAGSLKMPEQLLSKMPSENCQWLGYQNKSQVDSLFMEHHVLLFPTHSDGFGLVQLEALAKGVPVIASTHCGSVVENGVNGLILEETTPQQIADAILRLLNDPQLLNSLASHAKVDDRFSFKSLVTAFSEIN